MTVMFPIRWMATGMMMAVVSCAAPKAVVLEQPQIKRTSAPAADSGLPVAAGPLEPLDDIRMPGSLLAMPGDDQFKAGKPGPSGPVTGEIKARPPAEPAPPAAGAR